MIQIESGGLRIGVFYRQEAFDAEHYPVNGRRRAGQEFLRELRARVPDVRLVTPEECADGVSDLDVLFKPDPVLAPLARFRGRGTYSLCGVTHGCTTLEVQAACRENARVLTARDGVVCPSVASYRSMLSFGLGGAAFRHIPFGVRLPEHVSYERPSDLFVVMTLGRFDPLTKEDPKYVYDALSVLADCMPRRRILLNQVGVYPNVQTRVAWEAAARKAAENGRFAIANINGQNYAAVAKAFRESHVFLSLTTNAQESFGLGVLEAMSFGLPVVCSGWGPLCEMGVLTAPTTVRVSKVALRKIQRLYELEEFPHDEYLRRLSEFVSVDTTVVADLLLGLAHDDFRRIRIGLDNRKRAENDYSWDAAIARYVRFWRDLREQPVSESRGESSEISPWEIFSAYGSSRGVS
jgi:glycosyltransferase involved in cell wall biosynthesis